MELKCLYAGVISANGTFAAFVLNSLATDPTTPFTDCIYKIIPPLCIGSFVTCLSHVAPSTATRSTIEPPGMSVLYTKNLILSTIKFGYRLKICTSLCVYLLISRSVWTGIAYLPVGRDETCMRLKIDYLLQVS